ncbi:uncharacterized protein LOC122721795 [Manihot esculenta]|uniref:uncharacterized protein LOC122721795 n=1 Tax=Manihot esculenta TaxID=3983 RepID=UPI001CC35470|nr:uncharacterized protein LOC122721795 [Manihot esculenta]
MFYAMEEEKRITEIPPPQPAPRAQPMPDDPEELVHPPRRPRRRRSSRQQADPDVHTTVPANVIIPEPVSFHTHRSFGEIGQFSAGPSVPQEGGSQYTTRTHGSYMPPPHITPTQWSFQQVGIQDNPFQM